MVKNVCETNWLIFLELRQLFVFTFKQQDQQKDINEEKRKVLEAFDVLEDARYHYITHV